MRPVESMNTFIQKYNYLCFNSFRCEVNDRTKVGNFEVRLLLKTVTLQKIDNKISSISKTKLVKIYIFMYWGQIITESVQLSKQQINLYNNWYVWNMS